MYRLDLTWLEDPNMDQDSSWWQITLDCRTQMNEAFANMT